MDASNSDNKSDGARVASKEDVTEKKEESATVPDAETDAGSERFNPLRVLYEDDVRISTKTPKVCFQNIAAFESSLKKVGVWRLQQNPQVSQANKGQSREEIIEEAKEERRFLPHQMPVKSAEGTGQRHFMNLEKKILSMEGPLRMLADVVKMKRRLYVVVRNEHGVRGHIEGNLITFDKHWNLLLSNVMEVWRRRKYKYGVNKTCIADNPAVDCTERLASLGITLPLQNVKSLDRKNVEITRSLNQIMLRGEQIVLINILASKSMMEKV